MLKFIAVVLWSIGAFANYEFYLAFQVSGTMSLLLGVISQLIFTYLEHFGIRQKQHHKDTLFMSVIVFAAMLDVVMTSTGIYAKMINLPEHSLGMMIENMGVGITQAFLIIVSLVFGSMIALATEVIWHKA